MNARHSSFLLTALLTIATQSSADAALFRAYLSSAGNDANPCTVQQPCRLLPAALSAVASGGEIWLMDSANYNTATVNVAKSVTILAIPGAIGSLVATGGGDAITVNTSGVSLTLHNLVVVSLGSSGNGISFFQGNELAVDDCQISGVGLSGIFATATNSTVSISNTSVRNAGGSGLYALNAVGATLSNVRFENNVGPGVTADNGAAVTISNSVMANNGNGGVLAHAAAGTLSRAIVASSVITGNLNSGLFVFAEAGGTAMISADSDLITFEPIAFGFAIAAGSEAILTYGTNKLGDYGSVVGGPGVLTPLGSI